MVHQPIIPGETEPAAALLTAESIVTAILLVVLSAQIEVWDRNAGLGVYSVTIFLGWVWIAATVITLIRSISLSVTYLNTRSRVHYEMSYKLFELGLIATALFVFIMLISPVRVAFLRQPNVPLDLPAPGWVFPVIYGALVAWGLVLLFKPGWIADSIFGGLKKIIKADKFAVLVAIALLLIPLYLVFPDIIIFKPSGIGFSSNYGAVVFPLLLVGVVYWVGARLGARNAVAVLGFRRSRRQVLIGLLAGACSGVVVWYAGGGGSAAFPPVGLGIDILVGGPLVEEILFRGYLINRLLLHNRGPGMKALAIVASLFIFSWMHASHPAEKLIAGAVFTGAYVWGWKNNMTAAVMAHFANNAAILFIPYSALGVVTMLRTAVLILAMAAIVVLLIWMAAPLARGLSWAWAKIPRRSKPPGGRRSFPTNHLIY